MEVIKIIFENENFLAIDKPSGLVVHSDGRTEEESLTDLVKEYSEKNNLNLENIGNPHTLDSGRYTARWGIVNRLDRDTSGLILIAKNQEVFLELQKLFALNSHPLEGGARGGIKKSYQALVWGNLNFQEKIINEKLTRHKKDPRIWTCGFTASEGGRQTGVEAETWVTSPSPSRRGRTHGPTPLIRGASAQVTKVTLIPKTGRTHQLRLHCRFIGHPIVGDDKYGVNGKINEHSVRQIQSLMTSEILEEDKKNKLKLIAKSLEFQLFGDKYFLESKFELD